MFTDEDLKRLKHAYEWPLEKEGRACGIGCDLGAAGPGPKETHDPDCLISTFPALLARLEAAEAWANAEKEHRLDLNANDLGTCRLADEALGAWRKAAGK